MARKNINKFNLKNIYNSLMSFYNSWYGLINAIITLIIIGNISNKTIVMTLIIVAVIDFVRWWKNVVKNMTTKTELLSTVRQNNIFAVYGGVGTGKSTLAQFIINELVSVENQFTNTNTKGRKIFTSRHLILQDKLPENCGVLVDEAGRQYDSFRYDKEDNATRSRLINYNKFFRQFYGSNSYCVYVDQTEDNINTSIRRSIFYVILCKGVSTMKTALIPNLLFELFRLTSKKFRKLNNPFSVVSIEYMEFLKTGDFAKNYSINIEDKDHKKLVCPIQKLFGTHNTYVFRKYNPAKQGITYSWGKNQKIDDFYMEKNFQLQNFNKQINVLGLDLETYNDKNKKEIEK